MNQADKGIIGIVGGMGPEAGLALSRHIVYNTIARNDQDHLPQLLFTLPSEISDRTDYITGRSKVNPGISIASILLKMEDTGVNVAALACNSAHAPAIFDVILSELKARNSSLKLLHVIKETGSFILSHFSGKIKAGILGTSGTFITRQFDMLNSMGIEAINITGQEQKILHRAIYDPDYGIKSTPGTISKRALEIVQDVLTSLKGKGADIIILGCTELSLICRKTFFMNIPVVDTSVVLARALIKYHSPEKLKPL